MDRHPGSDATIPRTIGLPKRKPEERGDGPGQGITPPSPSIAYAIRAWHMPQGPPGPPLFSVPMSPRGVGGQGPGVVAWIALRRMTSA